MRKIGVITTTRADYGILQPVMAALRAAGDVELQVFAAGMHLSPEFGRTIQEVETGGWEITDRIEMLLSSDSPEGVALSMSLGVAGFARSFARYKPDLLVALGDRFEMHSAVTAALPLRIPVAHIHGGESSFGAIDDAFRHSITKLSHLHFPATEEYGRRIIRMGEEPWRVVVSGAPGLDNLKSVKLLTREEMECRFGLDLSEAPIVVTFHPVTLEHEKAEAQLDEVLAALTNVGRPSVITLPNADTGGRAIITRLQEYAAENSQVKLVSSLGMQGYFSLMALSCAMLGNSSSGIIEAASFLLPVVNTGLRQEGRTRASNVIDCGTSRREICDALQRALTPEFRQSLAGLINPYGSGNAAEKISSVLRSVPLDQKLLMKRFYDAV